MFAHDPGSTPPGESIRAMFQRGKYLSLKHSSYFRVYEALLGGFVGRPVTFVEIGILNGGSLFMWREFLGPQARIIGIDLNPAAKQWADHGFEIFIGDQSDPEFWGRFFSEVGQIDVLLDDGGHTNEQQIMTLTKAVDHVRDGGIIVVEDTHCSYQPEFGNPHKYSFVSFAKRVADHLHGRSENVPQALPWLKAQVWCITFFESIVAFQVDRRLSTVAKPVSNGGISADAKDFRYDNSTTAQWLKSLDKRLDKFPILWRVKRWLPRLLWLRARIESYRLQKFFR